METPEPPAPPTPAASDSLADGSRRALPDRAADAERAVGWIVTAVIGGGLLIALLLGLFLDWAPLWLDIVLGVAWLGVMGLFVWLNTRFVDMAHRRRSWRLAEDGIDLWQGVIWRRVTSIPRSRVQHTDVSQGPIQRSYDLATLSIHTAGTEYAQVQFEGLDHATALAIRDYLLDREASDGV